MSLNIEVRVGKKYAIYLPKSVVEVAGIKEGDRLLLRASKNKIVLEKIEDPLELAISGEKFASIKPEEIEGISLEEQKKYTESPP